MSNRSCHSVFWPGVIPFTLKTVHDPSTIVIKLIKKRSSEPPPIEYISNGVVLVLLTIGTIAPIAKHILSKLVLHLQGSNNPEFTTGGRSEADIATPIAPLICPPDTDRPTPIPDNKAMTVDGIRLPQILQYQYNHTHNNSL